MNTTKDESVIEGIRLGDFLFRLRSTAFIMQRSATYSIAFGLAHASCTFTEQHHVSMYMVCICGVALKVGYSIYRYLDVKPPILCTTLSISCCWHDKFQTNEKEMINKAICYHSVYTAAVKTAFDLAPPMMECKAVIVLLIA